MFAKLKFGLLLILILSFLPLQAKTAQAARGVPGSSEFGFGAILYPEGPYLDEALKMAATLGLDWLNVPVNWATFQPDPSAAPQWERLDQTMQFASSQDIAVMVSLSGVPDWAQTEEGPDPAQAAQFVAALAQRYPGPLRAVEVFPGANTRAGWGAAPDPVAYLTVLRAVRKAVQGSHPDLLLVAGGLRSLSVPPPDGDQDDLIFLQNLYQQGGSDVMAVISLQFPELTGSPLFLPTASEQRVLRHYEEVRRVMSANGQTSGLIWVTQISLPSGTINSQDSAYQDAKLQGEWVSQAYAQMRSQLYLGVGFLQSLNPAAEGAVSLTTSLIQGPGSQHPLYAILQEMIGLNKTGTVGIKPGKPKGGNLGKKR